jgi:DNA-binding Lrp family transcriptional regulator
MDAKDVRIFCEMAFKNPRFNAFRDRHISPSGIGRNVGLDEKTVRVRVRKMEDEGFIKYYQALPSLALFGLRTIGSYRFEALNIQTKHNVAEHIQRMPYVVEAFDYIGPHISISIAGTSNEDVQTVADSIASRYELSQLRLGEQEVTQVTMIPDKLDWQIMRSLRYSARSTTKDVAKALSITPRMAEYRIRKLLSSGTMLVRAVIDPRKQQGLIFYELELSVHEERKSSVAGQLEKVHGEKLWLMRESRGGILLANLFGFNLGEPEEAALNSLKMEGVRSCSLYILKEVIEPQGPNWIDSIMKQEIEEQ